MEHLLLLADFILHVDQHLQALIDQHGQWIYALLFLIVFVETGVVLMPFLPGDSLLFVVGALAGAGLLELPIVIPLLLTAAVLGDQVNYTIGRYVGPKVFSWEGSRFFNQAAFHRAHAFYERYGGITVVLARFMPFVRTFVPFVAGVAAMSRPTFTAYNLLGGVLWVVGLTVMGYLLGNLPWVKANLSLIIWGLILGPGLLALWGMARSRRATAP